MTLSFLESQIEDSSLEATGIMCVDVQPCASVAPQRNVFSLSMRCCVTKPAAPRTRFGTGKSTVLHRWKTVDEFLSVWKHWGTVVSLERCYGGGGMTGGLGLDEDWGRAFSGGDGIVQRIVCPCTVSDEGTVLEPC